ncbi:hypothetical protein M409DRAFT_26617 [Zasmidium cellare ATCC 36951]|uniref:Aspartate aminotransferase n=1 Tax=Zasmidium cellare ATCC 36951 TaxID=1080233 RepID=A0A6A6C7U4_ZASCE|nr:uncharacterized protein M409DRAFT_26617 [Zasmidium cellare ATCC 36951]KAF2163174.1 hypothetical protein M409DRAFT_26617 [Zasmidium cellare ATCC 36951]
MASAPTSHFSHLPVVPLDSIYAIKQAYAADKHNRKVILGSGVYRDDHGDPWVLPVVREAERMLEATNDASRYEYLPITGSAPFHDAARDLVFGSLGSDVERVVSIHTIAGTGANSLGARFLKDTLNPNSVWLPDPTWVNHHNIWSSAGVQVRYYPYWDVSSKSLTFGDMKRMLETHARPKDVVVLHACAHNPTGVDPTRGQWKAIADVCERKGLFHSSTVPSKCVPPLGWEAISRLGTNESDSLGFATGDLDADAWSIRHFQSRGTLELAVAQSFSKNMGLYGERVGALHLWMASKDAADKARGHLTRLQRGVVSTPPKRGARIATLIMLTPTLLEKWKIDLQVMSSRIKMMRQALHDELVLRAAPGDWKHIISQTGMFSYTGLTPEQVEKMQAESHVYMHESGRMSVAGLTTANVQYVAAAVHAAIAVDAPTGGNKSPSAK